MLANHKGEIPFLLLLLPFLLGITLGLNFPALISIKWILLLILFTAIVFITLNLLYAKLHIYKARWLGGVLTHITLLLIGWLSVITDNQLNNKDHFSKKPANLILTRIISEPIQKHGLIRFQTTVEQTITDSATEVSTGKLLITIKDSDATRMQYGDRVLLPAKFKVIDPPFNPAEFNYKQYLAHQNIYHQAFLYPGQHRVMSHDNGNALISFAIKSRQTLVEKLKVGINDTTAFAVASTLILGYKADLSNDIVQAYSKTGTIHILSVSGGHVAIVYLLLNFILSFVSRYKQGKALKAVIIITFIWSYAVLTGFSPAVCRAALMISLVIAGKTYSRYINTLNILAFSAFLMLLYNPFYLVDVGFQLSYLAVAGIVVLQPLIYQQLTVQNKWLNKLWMACTISIAAQAVTFPLSALYFHQFPVYFLISNLLILIPVEIILGCGMVYLLLPHIPTVSEALALILEKTIAIMNHALIIIEQAPFASINKIWINTAELVLLMVIIGCLAFILANYNKRMVTVGLAAILLLSLSITLKRTAKYKNNSITFLNLRKDHGIVFKHADSAIIITNLVTTNKKYLYSIQPFLDSIKVSDTSIHNLTNNISSTFLHKYRNLVQFGNKKILIVNDNLESKETNSKLQVDYLYLTGNPHITLNKLNESFVYHTLIVDGSNSTKRVADIAQQAKDLHLSLYILKDNPSLTISVR